MVVDTQKGMTKGMTQNMDGQVGGAGEKLFPAERRAFILDSLRHEKKVLSTDLSQRLGVSTFTIRSDLDVLAKEGKIQRCYGGAISVSQVSSVDNYGQRQSHMTEAKAAIGRVAADMVSPGDSVFIDTGTTTLEMARCMAGMDSITVLTNDLAIADFLEEHAPAINLWLFGGQIKPGYRYTTGISVVEGIGRYQADIAFLSSNGFSLDVGFSSEDADQARIKRAYLEHSSKRVMLIDSSKFGVKTFANFGTCHDLDVLITESNKDAKYLHRIQEKSPQLKVLIAD